MVKLWKKWKKLICL